MYVEKIENVKKEKVEMEGGKGIWIQWLISKNIADNYAMRLFTVEKDGVIPKHHHPWEHEIYILQGKGIIGAGDEEREVEEGYFAYIPPNIPHWYINTGNGDWKFLCIIPMKGVP